MIKQLSVFLENDRGRLARLTRCLADANINMHDLFIADTSDFGVVRIFCDTPEKALSILRNENYRATLTDVIAIKIPNRPGGLADVLEFLNAENVNIEYGYCFSLGDNYAIDVLKVEDTTIESLLQRIGFEIVKAEDVYSTD